MTEVVVTTGAVRRANCKAANRHKRQTNIQRRIIDERCLIVTRSDRELLCVAELVVVCDVTA